MGILNDWGSMREEDAVLFKRCVRKLLDSTFIVADRDEKLYDYLSAESNAYNVSAYLRMMGYDLVVKDEMKVAMLVQNEEDRETVGIKRISLLQFDHKQIEMLLVLWLLYLERVGFTEEVFVTIGDISDRLKLHGMLLTPAEFYAALKLFKRFNLIYFTDDEKGHEDGTVKLYPSLQFCMDIGQLKQVMAGLDETCLQAEEEPSRDSEENEEEPDV